MIQEPGVPTIVHTGNWVTLCGQQWKIEHLSIGHIKMRLASWHCGRVAQEGQELELNGRAWYVQKAYDRQVILHPSKA